MIEIKENKELQLGLIQILVNKMPNYEKIRQQAKKDKINLEYRVLSPEKPTPNSSVKTLVKVSCGKYNAAWSKEFGKKESYDAEAVNEQVTIAQDYIDLIKDRLENIKYGF